MHVCDVDVSLKDFWYHAYYILAAGSLTIDYIGVCPEYPKSKAYGQLLLESADATRYLAIADSATSLTSSFVVAWK